MLNSNGGEIPIDFMTIEKMWRTILEIIEKFSLAGTDGVSLCIKKVYIDGMPTSGKKIVKFLQS